MVAVPVGGRTHDYLANGVLNIRGERCHHAVVPSVPVGRQMTDIKRRQEIVFSVWYSLLVVLLILPHSASGWAILLDVSFLGSLAYWFVLGRSSAKKGQ